MAGDYLFPKRLFKDGEPLETNEVNEVVVEAGERLNGHLNQHNIRAPINASVLAAEGTFYRTFTVTEDADPKVVHASSGSPPQGPQPQNAFDVGQNTSWQVIESSKAMAVELETGKSMLAMTAHVSHCYQNDDASVREVWRFTMPSLADFGLTQQQYVDFFDEETNRLEVEIYLDAPGSADASAVVFFLFVLCCASQEPAADVPRRRSVCDSRDAAYGRLRGRQHERRRVLCVT